LTIAEDPEVRGARTLLVLGWLSALWHRAQLRRDDSKVLQRVRTIMLRELANIVLLTEADWPYFMSIILFIERDATTTTGEKCLNRWIEAVLRNNRGESAIGFPSPYWLEEKALALLRVPQILT
jgi:hypothetical protein